MPPVRWKTLYIITFTFQIWTTGAEQNNMQNPITMTSDGWRPIVGNRRPAPEFESDLRTLQYKSPRQKTADIEIIKSVNPNKSTTEPEKIQTETSTKTYSNINGGPTNSHIIDNTHPHSMYKSPKYQMLTPSSVIIGRTSQFGLRKNPVKSIKPEGILKTNLKGKQVRGQIGAHSSRNEVFIHPSTALNFPFVKQGSNNVKTRETQGLGLYGSVNYFTVNQPIAHGKINRFPSLNENVFEQYKSPGVTFLVSNIKNQPDEYSRNLVPPPQLINLAEKEKLKNSKIPSKLTDNVGTTSESGFDVHEQFGVKTSQIRENLVQVPAGFDQNFILHKQFKPKPPTAIDVQVTKENLKVYHNIHPGRFNTNGAEYIDYDYHAIPSPVQVPKLQTYEVTEGKWIDNPNPYTFNFVKSQDQSPNLRNKRPIGPPLPNPQITNEPIVEINLQPFLPTPYRPNPAIPTSPTQSEVSTVFSEVSKKMQKFKTAQLADNPLFFDIKEVSTHYPILGKPEFIQETQTDSSAMNNDISNEVTTQQEELTTKKRRRKPQPRRPPVTTTAMTEEPQETTEVYDAQKTQEEVISKTEIPTKRPRQRPNRYKVTSTATLENQDSHMHRTTTPSNEYEENSGGNRLRGRNRYRQRVKEQSDFINKDQNDIKIKKPTEHTNSFHHKRTRPTTTPMPINHKLSEKDNREQIENTEFKSKYFQNTEETIKPQRIIKYDKDSINLSNEKSSEGSYESTPFSQLENVMVKLHIDEKDKVAVTSSPEETTMINFYSSDTELDSTTISLRTEIQDEPTQSTLDTTSSTSTSTDSKTTTSKTNRMKIRPTIYKSTRPRFSVKDYRQRLNQFSTTTPSTTTDFVKTSSEGSRFRFPSRFRTRPTYSTTVSAIIQEDTTTEPILKRRFKPKDPRHKTTEATNIIPETNIKSINTDLKPFDRNKARTQSSVKTKIPIKSSFYLNRRPMVTTKINLVDKENFTKNITVKDDKVEDKSRDPDEDDKTTETTTVYQSNKASASDVDQLTNINISDDDYSQRISDLTSSFRTEYDTPGLFKSVAPISRRVPNYFTISTEDPILPIEAFFPGIKEMDKESQQ